MTTVVCAYCGGDLDRPGWWRCSDCLAAARDEDDDRPEDARDRAEDEAYDKVRDSP